ncbi:MAG: hypothetical protein AMXMBFR47_30860 [Planctomycetota bacterium]
MNQRRPQPASAPRPSSSPLERLFVAWLLSTLLIIALLAVLTLLGIGQLRRHADALNRQQAQLDELTRRIESLAAVPPPALTPPRATQPATESSAEFAREPQTSRPAAPPPLDDDEIAAEFDAIVGGAAARSGSIFLRPRRPDRAAALLTRAESQTAADASLSAASLARLRLLAQLTGDDQRAAAFGRAAAEAPDPAAVDDEIAARLAFESGALTEAFAHAILWVDASPTPPTAALLILAICAAAQDDLDAAADAIDSVSPSARLDAASLAAIGDTCIAIEAWKPLERWIAAAEPAVRTSPPAQQRLATLLVHTGRHTDALAVIAALLDERPADVDLLILQAAALTEARQFEAAKAALARITVVPVPPAAAYWRGVIEMRTGSPAEARKWFAAAVGAGRQSAAALEGLAQLDLAAADAAGSGDAAAARRALSSAEKNLAAATRANPRRSSAHFLLAIVHAKSSRAAETRAALRTAVQLDAALAEQAKKVPVIARLIPPDEIDQLASATD